MKKETRHDCNIFKTKASAKQWAIDVGLESYEVTNNDNGVVLDSSSDNTVSGNTITNNGYGVYLESSSYNTVSGNNITNNDWNGVILSSSSDNNVSGNNITNNDDGVYLGSSSSNNTVSSNNITNNGRFGVWLYSSTLSFWFHWFIIKDDYFTSSALYSF